MKSVIIIAIAFVLLIPTTAFAQIEPEIDNKSIFDNKKFDTTTMLTNHNGVPFYFKFERDFSETESNAYYQLYKVTDSRNNERVGDLRIYVGSSQWWNDNAFLQEKDTSGFSNIIRVQLFVIHLTDPKKMNDVVNSLSSCNTLWHPHFLQNKSFCNELINYNENSILIYGIHAKSN